MGITAYQLARALHFPGCSVVVPVGTSMDLESSRQRFSPVSTAEALMLNVEGRIEIRGVLVRWVAQATQQPHDAPLTYEVVARGFLCYRACKTRALLGGSRSTG